MIIFTLQPLYPRCQVNKSGWILRADLGVVVNKENACPRQKSNRVVQPLTRNFTDIIILVHFVILKLLHIMLL